MTSVKATKTRVPKSTKTGNKVETKALEPAPEVKVATKVAAKTAPVAKVTVATKAAVATKVTVATKAAGATKVAPVVEVAAVDVPTTDLVDEVAADDVNTSDKKIRMQLATILNIGISQARCATHLKHNLGDETVEAQIKELRLALKDSKESDDVSHIKAQIIEKSKTLVRISSETPIAVAVIWDSIIREILKHGMKQAINNDRKIVDVSHIQEGDKEELLYYPLYNRCPDWLNYSYPFEEELKKTRAVQNKLAKEVKGSKQTNTKLNSSDEDEESTENTKTTFHTYVENVLKSVKKEDEYKNMRVSNRVRDYLANLVTQGIFRISTLAKIIVKGVMGVRTMNADHVKAVAIMLMTDGGRNEEQIKKVTDQIDEKLAVYQEHLKSEKTKKLESLDEETKNENERKKHEVDLIRMKKQTELAQKRVLDATQKADQLVGAIARFVNMSAPSQSNSTLVVA